MIDYFENEVLNNVIDNGDEEEKEKKNHAMNYLLSKFIYSKYDPILGDDVYYLNKDISAYIHANKPLKADQQDENIRLQAFSFFNQYLSK